MDAGRGDEAECKRKLGSQNPKWEPGSPVGTALSAAHLVKIQSRSSLRRPSGGRTVVWEARHKKSRVPVPDSGQPSARQENLHGRCQTRIVGLAELVPIPGDECLRDDPGILPYPGRQARRLVCRTCDPGA